jgi:hypothetical protein
MMGKIAIVRGLGKNLGDQNTSPKIYKLVLEDKEYSVLLLWKKI